MPLPTILEKLFITKESWHVTLLQNWSVLVGNLKTHIRLEKILNDKIIVSVTDSAWMQEMYFLSDVLVAKINKTLDKPRIKTVRFIYGAPYRSVKRLVFCKEHYSANYIPSAHELHALHAIDQVELRAALQAFLVRCKSKVSYENCLCAVHQSSCNYS